jgi:hypothetical protein
MPVNTTYANTLYPGGVLTVTTQNATGAENTGCGNTALVVCTSPPLPSVSPLLKTVQTGQTVSFALTNVNANTWYSVRDNTGISYATANYSTNTTGFNLVTNVFTNPGTYSLTISADALTGCPASTRLASVTVNPVTLPVNFVQVSAQQQADAVLTEWTVTNEVNVDHYEVERSEDCSRYTVIASVPYAPVSTVKNRYQHTDTHLPLSDSWCYRIRQVDKNGRSALSSVAIVQATQHKTGWQLTPNPAIDHASILLSSVAAGTRTVTVLSMQGQVLYRREVSVHKGLNTFALPALTGFALGIYSVQLQNGEKYEANKLIISR